MAENRPEVFIPEFEVPFIINVPIQYDGARIDKFIADILPDMSRSFVQKLIKSNRILAGSKTVKSNYRLSNSESLTITIPTPEKLDIQPENIDLNIVYEDSDIIIVNKPKGMVVHPAPGHYSGTLVNALLFHCKDNLSGINGVLRPGIVHRIDKDTTGLIVACKNDLSHRFIAEQLATHSISRRYQAIVFGNLKENSGIIDKNISRNPIDRKKMSICSNDKGKKAITHYNVIDRFLPKSSYAQSYTHVECVLETGRTHQIRVHMSSIHHPLLGDKIYGYTKQPFETEGQVLHAKTLGFIHPTTKKYIEFNSDLPQYFKLIINKINSK